MRRTNFIEHRGKKILHMNFTHMSFDELEEAIEEAKPIIASEPPHSILGLLDVTGTPVSRSIAASWKVFAAHNEPYIKTSALVGVEGIKKIIYQAVLKVTGRKNLILKSSFQKAKDWLVAL